jgi:DNA-binding transcriptional MocR family regulator
MQTLLHGLDTHLPTGVAWTRPQGGYTVWLTLRTCSVSEKALVDKLWQAGVKLGPGSRYFHQPPKQIHLRLSIACVGDKEIKVACGILGQVLRQVL